MEGLGVILILVAIIGGVFLMRLFGAWMLRIDEVIEELRGIRKELKQQHPVEDKAKLYDLNNPKK